LWDYAVFSLSGDVVIADQVEITGGVIGTADSQHDVEIGNHSTVSSVITAGDAQNYTSDGVTVNGDIEAGKTVQFGHHFSGANILSGDKISLGQHAEAGDLTASGMVEIGHDSNVGTITENAGAVHPEVPTSLPLPAFPGGGDFVDGQVFTPGVTYFGTFDTGTNTGITFDFTDYPTGQIVINVAGLTSVQENFDITVKLGDNACTVDQIFNNAVGPSCSDPGALKALAGQVLLQSQHSVKIRDGADFFGTVISHDYLTVKTQGSTGLIIGALISHSKNMLLEQTKLQYVRRNDRIQVHPVLPQ
jgi:hypothetical protein